MASDAQVKFFQKLTEERDFGDQDTRQLRTQFADLTERNASQWIERALKLQKRDDTNDPTVAPPF